MADVTLREKRSGLFNATLNLSLATLLTRLLTFFTQLIIAYLFGAGLEADAFFAAEYAVLVLSDFIVIGFSAAFIPIWMEYKVRHGEEEARALAHAFISLVTGFTVALAAILALASPAFVRLLAPGFSPEAAALTSRVFGVMALSIAFLGLTAGSTSLLEAHGRFVIPEFSRIANRVVILIAAIALTARFGIMALAWGSLVGSLIQLLTQLPITTRIKAFGLTRHVRHPAVFRVGRILIPIVIGYSGLRVTMLLGNAVASGLSEGAVAALSYANRITLLPVGLLALPLRTTIFPTLSRQVASGKLRVMGQTALRGMRSFCFLAIPIAAGIIFLRVPLIQLLLERGAFDRAATLTTADVMAWLTLSLPAIGGMMIVNSIFFSLSDPGMLVRINLISWIATLILSLSLVEPLAATGIAMSITISMNATFALALLTLRRRLPEMDLGRLFGTILRAAMAAGIMFGALSLIGRAVQILPFSQGDLPTMTAILALLGSGLLGMFFYLAAAYALRMDAALEVIGYLSRLIRRAGGRR